MPALEAKGPMPLRIARADYAEARKGRAHIFLAGDLKIPERHPYFRDPRFELILCDYAAGDDGLFHWHGSVTEYEFVLEGRVGYKEAASRETVWYGPGDVAAIPAGVCVKRLVPEASKTLALKLPSSDEKTHCGDCGRECPSRCDDWRTA